MTHSGGEEPDSTDSNTNYEDAFGLFNNFLPATNWIELPASMGEGRYLM